MLMKRFFGLSILVVGIILAFSLIGCASTTNKAASAPDSVGGAAVDEATDAVKDNVREEVRKGVNSIFR